eukprot:scaffold14886_cov44-Attheya_sp.AAC.2
MLAMRIANHDTSDHTRLLRRQRIVMCLQQKRKSITTTTHRALLWLIFYGLFLNSDLSFVPHPHATAAAIPHVGMMLPF